MQLPVASSSSSSPRPILSHRFHLHGTNSLLFSLNGNPSNAIHSLSLNHSHRRRHHEHRRRRLPIGLVCAGSEEDDAASSVAVAEDELEPTPEDLEYVSQIKRVLELLRKNRDMLFGEVKLTIMIEDPREVERKRLLGIDDSDGPTRDDLVAALEEVNEGRVPGNRVALRMLAEELASWPNLEVEVAKTKPKGRSLYAKATDTGIDPVVAAQRLNVDWDSAAAIEEKEGSDETEVPPAVGS